MKKNLIKFIEENKLNPFNSTKTSTRTEGNSIYKTKDAKSIHTRVLNKISQNFIFNETSNLWNNFPFTQEINTILERQEFFKSLNKGNNIFLKNLSKPRQNWSPQYGIVAVTEDESTFVQLKKLACPVQLIISENDILDLENYDIVQAIDCENYGNIIERLPQSISMNSIENIYLERYLEELSGWRENFEILKQSEISEEMKEIVLELTPLFNLIDSRANKTLSIEEAEKVLEKINEKISEKIREKTITGDSLLKMLAEGKMPKDFLEIIEGTIAESGLPQVIFNIKIPVELDYQELESQIKIQSANEFTDLAGAVKIKSEELKKIPQLLDRLSSLLLVEDFCLGIANFISEFSQFPTHSENLHLSNAKNIFLTNAQQISFQLDNFSRCSILTGANSGGKTTLIEHLIQNISLFQLGLPIVGEVHLPIFSEIYYFAKNKGSASKGAFETLLTQMSKIKPGKQTLILADEIEAVTEPGVAGKIISATAEYFIKQNCFLVIATHLGYEIQKNLPEGCRMDGIEAKGLDENYNLIVDHNPVLGRLAHSTPELIVERMANAHKGEYFEFLHNNLKKEDKC